MKNWYQGKEIILIGGTGSLSKALLQLLFEKYSPKGVRIYSRDEYKQWELKKDLQNKGYDLTKIAFLLGEIRDFRRLKRAMQRVDIAICTAAQKHVLSCEENPIEAIKTNIHGSENVIDAALDLNIEKVMFISSDKAVAPSTNYGATKLVGEKLFINANVYSAGRFPFFSCCRYGNVLGSRGSIVPLFRKQAETGVISITHEMMSRFWVTLETIADFILQRIMEMNGGEIFIPKMKIASVLSLAKSIAPNAKIKIIGTSPGEKIFEEIITEEESKIIQEFPDYYVIKKGYKNEKVFSYTSEIKEGSDLYSEEELIEILKKVK